MRTKKNELERLLTREMACGMACGNAGHKEIVYKVKLKQKFGGQFSYWCVGCIVQNRDMINFVAKGER